MAHTPQQLVLSHEGARSPTSASPHAFWAAQSPRSTAAPLPSSAPDAHPLASRWKKTKKRAPHHPYCQACAVLTAAADKALAYCATHAETVLGLLGLDCEESGVALKQAPELSKSKPEHL